MLTLARKLWRNCKAGTAIEYGLICALIVLAMVGALTAVAKTTTDMWNMVSDRVIGGDPAD